jgi:hypothetical protein
VGQRSTLFILVSAGQTWRYNYLAGTTRIAMRVINGAANTNELYFLITDPLNGTSKTVTLSGEVTEIRYCLFFISNRRSTSNR